MGEVPFVPLQVGGHDIKKRNTQSLTSQHCVVTSFTVWQVTWRGQHVRTTVTSSSAGWCLRFFLAQWPVTLWYIIVLLWAQVPVRWFIWKVSHAQHRAMALKTGHFCVSHALLYSYHKHIAQIWPVCHVTQYRSNFTRWLYCSSAATASTMALNAASTYEFDQYQPCDWAFSCV